MTSYPIRLFGDPVLKHPAAEVVDIDGGFVTLVDAMYDTMYDAHGVGLAAPQVGVRQRFFVYDVADDEGPQVLVNPRDRRDRGRVGRTRRAACRCPASRSRSCGPKLVTVQATDLDGNEVIVQGDELLGRCFLHEIDHLDGVLMFDRLDRGQRKAALKEWRERGPRQRRGAPALDPLHVRIVYFGSPAAAVPPLRALRGAGHDVALVVTPARPPSRPQRRARSHAGEAVRASSSVCRCARRNARARSSTRSRDSHADLGVVVAFGQLLPAALLEATAHGFVNVHFSLLPRWRGAAPVERAILAGDRETGVALWRWRRRLDTGGIFAEVRTPIGDDETAGELRDRLVALGTELLVDASRRGARRHAARRRWASRPTRPSSTVDGVRARSRARARPPSWRAWCAPGTRRPARGARSAAAGSRCCGPAPDDAADDRWTARTGHDLRRRRAACAATARCSSTRSMPEGKRAMPGAAWMAGQRGVVSVDA